MLSNMMFMLRVALNDRRGVTAAEYAILAVGIVGAVGAAVLAFKGPLENAFKGLLVTTP